MSYKSILDPQTAQKNDLQQCIDLKAALSRGTPSSTGKTHLNRYYSGEVLSYKESLLAKCCECSAHYVDGKIDCELHVCPLYPYMPYGKMRKSRNKGDAQML